MEKYLDEASKNESEEYKKGIELLTNQMKSSLEKYSGKVIKEIIHFPLGKTVTFLFKSATPFLTNIILSLKGNTDLSSSTTKTYKVSIFLANTASILLWPVSTPLSR